MSTKAELTPSKEAEGKRQSSAFGKPAQETASEQDGSFLNRAFGGAPGEPPANGALRVLRSPTLSHPANSNIRAVSLKHAQQTFGNRFAQRAVAQIQRKPATTARLLQRHGSCAGACSSCQGKEVKEEPKLLQRQSAVAGAPGEPLDASVVPSSSTGQPLDKDTRNFMEGRFGTDFSDVRIHTGAPAAQSADALQADAYATGRDIYFAEGKYAPETTEGQHLLAHELTHTIQQTEGASRFSGTTNAETVTNAVESEAEAAADAIASGARPHVTTRLAGELKGPLFDKGGKSNRKAGPTQGTYAVKKSTGAYAYSYTFNSEDVLNSPDPWEMVVSRHFRNVFPTVPASVEQALLEKLTFRVFRRHGESVDVKAIAKEAATTTFSIETGLHNEMLSKMKSLYPNVSPFALVEATYGLEEARSAGVQAPATTGTGTPPTVTATVRGHPIHLPGNLNPDDKEKILKVLDDVLVAPDPNQKPEKQAADLFISLKGAEMLLQIANDPVLLARLKSVRLVKGDGPDFEESLEIAIANEAREKQRKRLGLDDPTESSREKPIVNRPVHGEIKNLTGYLVPTQEARFTFEVLDDRDAFRVPMISIRWFAYPKGQPENLVDKEVTNYIPVRSQGFLNDSIFNVTFDQPGEYEIEAAVQHNFFEPASFILPNGVRVVTELALAQELNKEELKGFAGEGRTTPHLYRVGGVQGLQVGTETRGKLDPKATILSIENHLKTTADEEKLINDLIDNYKWQQTSEARGIVEWAQNYLKTIQESKASLKEDKDKGAVPVGIRGVFISRETDYPTKPLTLLCYFFRTPEGYLLILRDFTQLSEPEDYRFEAKDKTVEQSEEKAFLKQATAYPFGTLSITFQSFDETTQKPTNGFIRFEKITDTPEKKLKKFLFGTAMDIAVNLLAAILMIIPGLQLLGIALAITYNTAKTVSELEDAANKGTLTGGKVAVGLAQIALNLLPLAGRGAKLMTIAGKTFYVMEGVNVAGNILLITEQGMSEVDKVRNGVIKELAKVDSDVRHLEKTNMADPSLPDLKKRRRELIKEGEDATVKVFTDMLKQQALMMVGQHLVMGYMSRKFSVGQLKSEGTFRHEKDANARYDFKEGVIVGDEIKISPVELERLQHQHGQNKALEAVIADPGQRQKVVEAFSDRPVEVRIGAAKTGLKQEGGKIVLEISDGANPADILSEAQKAAGSPATSEQKPLTPPGKEKVEREKGKTAPEDTFKPIEPKKKGVAVVEKEAVAKSPLGADALEAQAEVASSLEARAKAAYTAAKKKGFQQKTAKAKQLTEQDFIDKYELGEVFNPETSRFYAVERGAKPPPEPFPAGTDTQMILERLTGKESTSSFKKYSEMLKRQELADEAELRAAIDEVRKKFNLDTEAATVDDVRHALKEKFRPRVVKSMLEAADGTRLDPKASHKKMLEVTGKLNSADKGTLNEEWVQETRRVAREAMGVKDEVPQKVIVKKADHPALAINRELDRIEGDTINEIKSTDGYLNKRDKEEIADHLALIGEQGVVIDVRGKPQTVKKERLTFTYPEGGRKNADYIIEQLEAFETTLSVEVFNDAGESKIFTAADVTGANTGKLHEFLGKTYKK